SRQRASTGSVSSARAETAMRSARVTANGTTTERITAASARARQVEPLVAREAQRVVVAGVGVSHDPGPGISREHALELRAAERRAVRDADHPGVDRVPDPDAAAVMHGDPGR